MPRLKRFSVIGTNDAKSMFYQFEMDRSLRSFFNFARLSCALPNRQARLRVLPMGICFAPTWAQHLSQYLLDVLRRRMHTAAADSWAGIVWIDNFIFAADSEGTLAIVKSTFDLLAKEVNLVMKGWEGGGHALDILGVHIDLRLQTATPVDGSVRAMEEFVQSMRPGSLSAREFLHGFGGAGFVSYAVARYPLCLIPRAMDLVRMIGRRRWLQEPVAVPQELRQEVEHWSALLTQSAYTPRRRPLPAAGYATDASTTGIGAVVHSEAGLRAFRCGCDTPHTGIHVAEMLAGLIAAAALEGEGEWATDNTTAFYSLVRGHSGSRIIDAIIRLWIELACVPPVARRVASEDQPADGLSRGSDPAPSDWARWTALPWRTVGQPLLITWTTPQD